MDPRREEDLVGVDVADAGEHLLVHERRLDPAARPAKPRGELVAADLQGIGAVRAREGGGGLVRAGEPVDLAQPPRVAIPDHRLGFRQPERQADVFGSIGIDEPKASSHPRLDDDDSPVIGERDHDPLSPATHLRDLNLASPPRELLRVAALEQEGIVDLDPLDEPALEGRPQPPHHRLDLR